MIRALSLIALVLSGKNTVASSNKVSFTIGTCNRFGLGITPCIFISKPASPYPRHDILDLRGGSNDLDSETTAEPIKEETETLYLPGLLDAIVTRKNVCTVLWFKYETHKAIILSHKCLIILGY